MIDDETNPPLAQIALRDDAPDTETPDETATPTPRGRPFPKGASGNPAGRPLGARNKATILAQSLLECRTRELADRVIELALAGNAQALKLCLERLVPRQREAAIAIELPPLDTLADCNAAVSAVVAGVSAGEITLRDARRLLLLIESRRHTAEIEEFGRRLDGIEARLPQHSAVAGRGFSGAA